MTLDPGTIFLECLALEYPCFLILSKFWEFKLEFHDHLKDLKDLNIVFENNENFLNFINNVDIDNFRKKINADNRLIKFKEKYCYYNKNNYQKEWNNFFKKLN